MFFVNETKSYISRFETFFVNKKKSYFFFETIFVNKKKTFDRLRSYRKFLLTRDLTRKKLSTR